MDKFEKQIAMLKPDDDSARLKERLFMKKLMKARRARQTRRLLAGLMAVATVAILAGALRRNILEVLALTLQYFTELPILFSAYVNAYISAISWPSVVSAALLLLLGVMLIKTRGDVLGVKNRPLYKYAAITGVFALGFAIVGLFGSPTHAAAQQEQLRRKLNERGHLEVRVNGSDYELYAKSGASDDSIRNQAFIEQIRNFDISKAYPNLKDMYRDGWVSEVRAVNTSDDCVFTVERRLEPTFNSVIDANAGCIRHSDGPTYYLNERLQPVKEPKWKTGQAIYETFARSANGPSNSIADGGRVIVLLPGKADDYVAKRVGEKLVPKGQPSTGVRACGINLRENCPATGLIDVFANAEGRMASGEIGSAVADNSLRPQAGSSSIELFGKITALDDTKLQLQTLSGQRLVISWPRNIIQEFNKGGGSNYHTASGNLAIQPGDSLLVRFYYKDGMDLGKLQLSDVSFIQLAIKTSQPDPLKNETRRDKSSPIEKY